MMTNYGVSLYTPPSVRFTRITAQIKANCSVLRREGSTWPLLDSSQPARCHYAYWGPSISPYHSDCVRQSQNLSNTPVNMNRYFCKTNREEPVLIGWNIHCTTYTRVVELLVHFQLYQTDATTRTLVRHAYRHADRLCFCCWNKL
jgi:hypothetical protein